MVSGQAVNKSGALVVPRWLTPRRALLLLLLGFSPDEVTVVEPDVLPAD